MDTILKVLINGGHYVRDDVVNSITQSIADCPDMYAFIGTTTTILIKNKTLANYIRVQCCASQLHARTKVL